MVCMSAVALCSFVIAFSNIRVSRQNSEDMAELMEMVATYMGSATEDEYEGLQRPYGMTWCFLNMDRK